MQQTFFLKIIYLYLLVRYTFTMWL